MPSTQCPSVPQGPPYPPPLHREANDLVPPAVPPSWVLEPADTRVSRGHALVVDCVARGHPEPSVTWKKKVTREGQSEYGISAVHEHTDMQVKTHTHTLDTFMNTNA